jgi:hypothetical protein
MNKRNKLAVFLITASCSLYGFSIPASANEGQATYAVVDSSGLVTNVIVCTESVCGPNGQWAGKMPSDTSCPGCSIVLQVAANPVTGANQGSVFSPAGNSTQVTYSEGTFTVSDNAPQILTNVSVDVINNETITTKLVVENPTQVIKTFTYEDTIGKSSSEINFNTAYNFGSELTVTGTETTELSTKQESTKIDKTLTLDAIESYIFTQQLNILSRKIATLTRMIQNFLIM